MTTQQTYFISLPMLMFAPAATPALQTKPVQPKQRTTQPTSDLVIALATLTLQHEQERQNRARSENVVLQASASHPMMQRSHGRDVRSRRENSESQPGGPVRWTHSRETTRCSLPRSSLQVGRKCAGERTGCRSTLTDGRDGRSSSEAGTQGGRTSSAEQRLEGSSLLPSQIQGRSRTGHCSVDFRSFSTATTNRGLVDSPRSQDTGTTTGSPAGRLCSQNQAGQAGATAGLWDSTKNQRKIRKRKGPTGDEGDEED